MKFFSKKQNSEVLSTSEFLVYYATVILLSKYTS